MYVIDVYAYGSGHRVRLHHHPYSGNQSCGPECDHYPAQRAYHSRGAGPSEVREGIADAVRRAVLATSISHRQFLLEVGEQQELPLDL